MMEYIQFTADNIEKEHICCAISNNNDPQVISKKEWLRSRMKEGLVFLKADIRGKCFIEYIPAEYAWVPIEVENYMHINCFWVSGSCKGHGYANDLLERCIDDAKQKGKVGITVVSSAKKKPYLSDPKYLAHKGFQLADKAVPNCCTYLLRLRHRFPSGRNVQKRQKMIYPLLSLRLTAEKRHRAFPLHGQILHCFIMGSMLQMTYPMRKNFLG